MRFNKLIYINLKIRNVYRGTNQVLDRGSINPSVSRIGSRDDRCSCRAAKRLEVRGTPGFARAPGLLRGRYSA